MLFAGTMLLVTGVINIFEGIIALVDDERLALDAHATLSWSM